jgi:hypothetical protein
VLEIVNTFRFRQFRFRFYPVFYHVSVPIDVWNLPSWRAVVGVCVCTAMCGGGGRVWWRSTTCTLCCAAAWRRATGQMPAFYNTTHTHAPRILRRRLPTAQRCRVMMITSSYHGHAIASAPRSALPRRRRRRAALGLRGGRHLSLPYCPPHNRSRPSVAALPAVLTVLSLSALVLPIRLCAARGGRTGAAGQYTLPSTPPPHNTFIRPAVVLARPSCTSRTKCDATGVKQNKVCAAESVPRKK